MAKKKSQSTKSTKRKQAVLPPGLLVSERVQLQDVRLWRCACEQRPGAHADDKKRYEITHSASAKVDESNGRICILPKFHFEAFGEDRDQVIVTVDATFVLTYSIADCKGLEEPHYQQFAEMNGVYNAWPYWRELVQTTIARMGLPALVLPVFRIIEPLKDRQKEEEHQQPLGRDKGPVKATRGRVLRA